VTGRRLAGEKLRSPTLGCNARPLGSNFIGGRIGEVPHDLPADRRIGIEEPFELRGRGLCNRVGASVFYSKTVCDCYVAESIRIDVARGTRDRKNFTGRIVGNSYLIGIMFSILHAHASGDSAVTCPYIGQKGA
jgi:hypothetical protein